MPRASLSELSSRMRDQAMDHPTVLNLCQELPELPDHAGEPGLYVETDETAGIVVNGELRVSLVRVMSVGEDGSKLVGQIQVTREIDHPLESWELRFYIHDPENFQTARADEPQSWFVAVLEEHYAATDASVSLEPSVEA